MKSHFEALADYNRWANRRLYADAAALPMTALTCDLGIYFGSLLATLEHILKVDGAWLHLLGGGTIDDLPPMPDVGDFAHLHTVREAQNMVLIERMALIDEAWLDSPFEFRSSLGSWQGMIYRGTRASVLTHLFNHQTHHRGQAHTALSLLGIEPSALDILVKGFLDR